MGVLSEGWEWSRSQAAVGKNIDQATTHRKKPWVPEHPNDKLDNPRLTRSRGKKVPYQLGGEVREPGRLLEGRP